MLHCTTIAQAKLTTSWKSSKYAIHAPAIFKLPTTYICTDVTLIYIQCVQKISQNFTLGFYFTVPYLA